MHEKICLKSISEKLKNLNLIDRLLAIRELVEGKIVFTSSLGLEDQAITHSIFSQNLKIDIVSLDTGFLFNETHKVWNDTEIKYKKRIKPFFPHKKEVEKLVASQGKYGFYESIENRKKCCAVRKLSSLDRCLKGSKVWITGIRANQTKGRSKMAFIEKDEVRGLLKVNPLFDWSTKKLQEYLNTHQVPTNILHAKGYTSIGCEPCTRAIKPGEDERAGRWWWENELGESDQECGLHFSPENKIIKSKA